MNGKQLKNSILQWAIQGKLVPQDPNDEPASVLLEQIRAEKARLVKEKKIKKDKNESIIFRGDDNSHYEKFSDGTVKCIDDEIPFISPSNWEWCKINDIAFVTKLAGFEYTKYIADNLQSSGVPLFKGKNVQDGHIVYEFEGYIPESLSDELYRSQISKKCLLTPYVGTIGNIGLHNKDGKFHLGSNVGKIEIFNPNNQICIMEEYLHLYLLSSYGYGELTKHKKATAQESISIEAIRDVYVVVPPLKEQIKIVNLINSVIPSIEKYDKIEKKKTLLNSQIKELLKKSILQEAIQGKLVPQLAEEGDASELLKQIELEKQKLVKEGKLKKKDLVSSTIFRGDDNRYYEKADGKIECIDEEIPFEIPESWRWCRLSSISEIIGGYAFPSQDIKGDSGTRVIRISDFNELGWVNTKIARYNDKEELTQYELKFGDILIAMTGGTVGKSLYVTNLPERMLLNQRVAIIRNLFVESSYIDVLIKSPLIQDIVNEKKNSTNDNISMGDITEFLIPLPPLSEQQRIIAKIRDFTPLVEVCNNTKTNLDRLNV